MYLTDCTHFSPSFQRTKYSTAEQDMLFTFCIPSSQPTMLKATSMNVQSHTHQLQSIQYVPHTQFTNINVQEDNSSTIIPKHCKNNKIAILTSLRSISGKQ
jgi:hypothetical protein